MRVFLASENSVFCVFFWAFAAAPIPSFAWMGLENCKTSNTVSSQIDAVGKSFHQFIETQYDVSFGERKRFDEFLISRHKV